MEVWGISDQEPSTVKVWLARYELKLQSLNDPDGKISEQYPVEGIPALVVIGRNGKILSYYTGNQSEQSLRYAIDMALSESQKDLTN
jgi:peroxiredoxin